ncbi:hypothetical protein [Halarchaeum sp. P4]|uniref:hypothetical protein n=1 Tax=Halarchaeum sp. P4 TaxID=3421639 RepID=UPI003EB72556
MGFIDIHVHGLDETELSLLRWDFSKGEETDADDAGIAPAPVETAEEEPVDTTDSRSPKAAALGFVVVLGFLVATGLLVKRKLGGGTEDEPVDERDELEDIDA